jgi:hypothetical protein
MQSDAEIGQQEGYLLPHKRRNRWKRGSSTLAQDLHIFFEPSIPSLNVTHYFTHKCARWTLEKTSVPSNTVPGPKCTPGPKVAPPPKRSPPENTMSPAPCTSSISHHSFPAIVDGQFLDIYAKTSKSCGWTHGQSDLLGQMWRREGRQCCFRQLHRGLLLHCARQVIGDLSLRRRQTRCAVQIHCPQRMLPDLLQEDETFTCRLQIEMSSLSVPKVFEFPNFVLSLNRESTPKRFLSPNDSPFGKF